MWQVLVWCHRIIRSTANQDGMPIPLAIMPTTGSEYTSENIAYLLASMVCK